MKSEAKPLAISPFLLRLFNGYTRRHLARHFHTLRLSTKGTRPAVDPSRPLVVFGNHPSWWDPLVALYLTETLFPDRKACAPIDAAALQRYGILKRLGFFGVDRGDDARGAAAFIANVRAILANPAVMLWLTPQGCFTDPRQTRAFEPGLAHIARRVPEATLLPMALEYPFWEERTPEILVRFGPPVDCASAATTEARLELLQRALTTEQEALAGEAIERDPAGFETLLTGKTGASPVYDLWRRASAKLRGESFDPRHGSK